MSLSQPVHPTAARFLDPDENSASSATPRGTSSTPPEADPGAHPTAPVSSTPDPNPASAEPGTPSPFQPAPSLGALEITWSDGRVDRIPYQLLRGRCPCAICVDELTGERRVFPQDHPHARLDALDPVGAYAWRLTFSDGHDTGLFTWPRLRAIGEEAFRALG